MNKKKRVVILGSFPIWLLENDIPAARGHYAVWLMALHEMLKEVQKYEWHWVCFNRNVSRKRDVVHANQVFHVLPCGSLELASRIRFMQDRWRVKRLLAQLKPDLVHAWGTESRYASCGADFNGKKILSMQGILSACERICPQGGYMKRQAAREVKLLPLFDVVTAESEWACARCREVSPQSRVIRWEYATEDRFFHIERKLFDAPTCLLAGSDTPIKNVDTAIKVFADSRMAGVTLLLAGTDPAGRPDLPPNIKPLGRVSRDGMAELLSGCWALLHPSLVDSSPNIIKEARVAGLPVVTTTNCGGAQYVDEGKSGYVVEAHDDEAMRQAVSDIVSSAPHALQMGAWQQDVCRQQLSRETMKQRICEIYDAVLAEREANLR